MERFDVVIVGAGPAGSIASYYLSKNGLKVGLLEKNALGRDKICGGGISYYALKELPFKLPFSVIEQEIKGINFISPKYELFQKKEIERMGITVRRSNFDSLLVTKAQNAGVEFLPNSRITKVRKNSKTFIVQGKYSSSYVIGADGANSVIKNLFTIGNTNQSYNMALRAYISMSNGELEEFMIDKEMLELYFHNHQLGYGWIFALRDAVNIGIGVKNGTNVSKEMLEKFINKNFHLRKQHSKFYHIEGFPIPNAQMPVQFSRNKVFLIGDAAGLVDPISGEGIHYALRSGKIVADTILKDGTTPLQDKIDAYYLQNLKRDILADLTVAYRLNHFLEKFFLHNMNTWFKVLKRNPFIFNYIPDLARKSNYYDVYTDVIKKLPKIALNLIGKQSSVPSFQYNENIASKIYLKKFF